MALLSKSLIKGVRKVLTKTGKYIPVVKVIQAGYSLVEAGQEVCSFIDIGDLVNETTPAMRIIAKSFCDTDIIVSSFVNLMEGSSINITQTYQGNDALTQIGTPLSDIYNTVEVQTTLEAPIALANLVYNELRVRLKATRRDNEYDHWYIICYPDTTWYTHFNRKISERPLSKRFCGYTNNLDMAVILIEAIRKMVELEQKISERYSRSTRRVKLHILIPADQLLLFPEFVQFPEDLSFVVEGLIYNGKYLVWLNIPEEQDCILSGIGNWKSPEAMAYQESGRPLEVRTQPEGDRDDDILSIASSTLRASSEDYSDDMH